MTETRTSPREALETLGFWAGCFDYRNYEPNGAEGCRRAEEILADIIEQHAALLAAMRQIAVVPCNCAPDKLPGDECESCIARAALAAVKGENNDD